MSLVTSPQASSCTSIDEITADHRREADDEESDEETREWEQAQANRAGGRYDHREDPQTKVGYVPSSSMSRAAPVVL